MTKQRRRKNNSPAIKVKRVHPPMGSIPAGVRTNTEIEELRQNPLPFPSSDEYKTLARLISGTSWAAAVREKLAREKETVVSERKPRKPHKQRVGVKIFSFPRPIVPEGLIQGSIPDDKDEVPFAFRVLGTAERTALESSIVSGDGFDFMNFPARVITLCLADEKGNRLIPEEEEQEEQQEIMKGYYPFRAEFVYALTLAALIANDMLPPPDQNMDNGKLIPFESLRDTLRREYPSWSEEKIDGCMAFMKHLRFAGRVFSFQRSYANKYRHGSKVRDALLPALPNVSDEKRLASAERFIGDRSPMHKKRIEESREAIWNDFGITSFEEEKEVIKILGRAALFPSVEQMREKLGVFAPDHEIIKETNRILNDETTYSALTREGQKDEEGKGTWRKKKTLDDPEKQRAHEEAVAYGVERGGIMGRRHPASTEGMESDFHDDEGMDFGFVSAAEQDIEAESSYLMEERLQEAIRDLTPKQRRCLSAVLEAKGDMDQAAKKLKVKTDTLEKAIYRIKKKI